MDRRTTIVAAFAVVVIVAAVAALAVTLDTSPQQDAVVTPETPEETPGPTAETLDTERPDSGEVETAQAESETETTAGSIENEYGLQPLWDRAYGGRSAEGKYDFDGDGEDEVEQCGNCHMEASGGIKNNPPLHPIGLGSGDTGEWFYDDGRHLGPVVNLATQFSGIKPEVQCGDCHTPTNPDNFGTPDAGASNNPHSVHKDVIARRGCIRCHTNNQRTFEGAVTFVQGGAGRESFGLANPINMTRVWDGKFLSTEDEATYSSTGDEAGSGWNLYGSSETDRTNDQSCGDCHDQYHKMGGLGFTFDSSAASRKGPVAPVNEEDSIGIRSGTLEKTCGDCHVTDAHAVHTNGKLQRLINWEKATNPEDTSMIDPEARGAELCDECHSQRLTQFGGGGWHGGPEASRRLGLRGPRNHKPDAPGMGYTDADCGFCHG